MELFKQVIAEDGTTSYEAVTLTAEDLEPELVKGTALYKDLLNESIERRHTIKDLKTQLSEAQPAEQEPQQTEPNPFEGMTLEDITGKVLETLSAQQAQEAQAKQERDATIESLMKEHSVPDSLRSVLANSNDMAATARDLGAARMSFDNSSGGDAGDSSEDLLASALAQLGISDDN